MVKSVCCGKKMFYTDETSLEQNIQQREMYICLICGSFNEATKGQLDFEDVMQIAGLTEEELKKTWIE